MTIKKMKEESNEIVINNGEKHLIDSNDHYYEFTNIVYAYEAIDNFPLKGKKGMARFLPLLPIKELFTKIKGLGDTPLQKSEKFGQIVGLDNLWIKREDLNPTGCFKDRESAVIASLAKQNGIDSVYIVSSGNAALSTAKFAKELNIKCTCCVPEKTTQDKKDLIIKYGAKLKTFPGFYEDVYRTVVDMHPEGWNVTSGQNSYRIEGGKTMAYEIFEQLGQVPDIMVIPCGNGGCLAATWKGFSELKTLGITNKMPQMVGVQVKDAAPIKVAVENRKSYVILGEIEDSIAEGIVAQESYNSPQAVEAITASVGYVLEVTDCEIVAALKSIIETEGIIPEPTAAATFAALPKLVNSKDKLVVAVNTGDGKKMMKEINHLIGETK